jgi:glycine oxidase
MRVTVVGAGVVGLACATELCEGGGVEVTVVDRAATPWADACSWLAGGMLAPWCERESAEAPVQQLGLQAAGWWQRHVDCVVHEGTLVLAHPRDGAELRRFAGRTQQHEPADAARIAALEPDLGGRFQQGLFFPGEAHLDPRKALAQLAAGLAARGVPVRLGVSGEDLPPSADVTIDCRGLAARDQLGELRGVKGEMVLVRTREIRLRRPVRLLHPRMPLYIVPRADGVFMIGATMIESDDRRRVSVRALLELLGAAFSLHPCFAEAEVVETGADARPAFPDNLPRVLRRGSTLYVNGLFRHGFLLAPALARLVARAVRDPGHDLELMNEAASQWQAA